MPRSALLLGVAGLIPFVGLSLLLAFAPALAPADAPGIVALDAAVILSYMGGVHWALRCATRLEPTK